MVFCGKAKYAEIDLELIIQNYLLCLAIILAFNFYNISNSV